MATDAGPVRLRVPGRTRAGVSRSTGARADRRVAANGAGTGAAGAAESSGDLRAPMDATVVAVPARCGARVEPGEVLVVLEAMKMELPVRATTAGEVAGVHVAAGDGVTAGTVLVALTG